MQRKEVSQPRDRSPETNHSPDRRQTYSNLFKLPRTTDFDAPKVAPEADGEIDCKS